MLVLWGAGGGRATQAPDMVAVWRARCGRVEGYGIPDSGHYIPEEQPAAVVDAVVKFVAA
jgi:haloacetate dehalogenase